MQIIFNVKIFQSTVYYNIVIDGCCHGNLVYNKQQKFASSLIIDCSVV